MKTGSRWLHKKRGSTYEVIGRAKMQIDRATLDTYEHRADQITVNQLGVRTFVVYRSEADDTIWMQPESEFLDGRFEEVA